MINQARRANGRFMGAGAIIGVIIVVAGFVAFGYFGATRTESSTSQPKTAPAVNGSCSAYGDEWLTYKHDSQRTGYSNFNFTSTTGKFLGQLVWHSKTSGFSEMVSAHHELFAAEYELDALNSSNGALLWSVSTGAGPSPTLSSDGKVVYAGSNLRGGGGLSAYDPASGHSVPASNQAPDVADACANAAYLSSGNGGFRYPTTDGRVVYSVIYNGTVTAFSANSGALIWKQILPGAQTSTEASNATTSTFSFNTSVTRTITVTVNQGVIGDNTPPLAGGKLFVTTRGGHVYALNATNGKQVWSTSLGATIYDPRASSAVGYGKLFLGTSKGLLAVSTFDGSVAWQAQLGSAYAWTPTVVDKTIFIADDNGTLYQFDANNGALLWHFSGLGRGWVSEPIVADGLIVIDSNNGVFAFR